MKTQADNTQESQNSITPRVTSESSNRGTAQLVDNRAATIDQRKLQEGMNAPTENSANPLQRKTNKTGLPDNLKSGIENLSGYSMDDVKVHYNSSKPLQLQAHAYAQGTDIHIAPGQQKHLPHEAWHVVQQKQGRVKPTMQFKGKVNINDDSGLEKEADVMGDIAMNTTKSLQMKSLSEINVNGGEIVQRVRITKKIKLFHDDSDESITWDDTNSLGGGQQGDVFEGQLDGQSVAIKTGDDVDTEIDIFKSIYQKLFEENDPSIVKPIGYNKEDKILVIEKADGSLDHTIPITLFPKLFMIKDMWKGLNFLHENGVVYQDMNQKNTLFKGGRALLADFGTSMELVGDGAPIPQQHIPVQEYINFIRTACNILLGSTGTNNTDSFMSPLKLAELRTLLTSTNVNIANLDTVVQIAGKANPTKQDCEDFITNLHSCISARRKEFMRLLNNR